MLASVILILAGCGSSNDKKEENPLVQTDKSRPVSPVTNEKEKSPPSIPVI